MLYPDFNELIEFKDRKTKLRHPSARAVKSAIQGNYHSPFRGQGLEFDSVREYVHGDDIRSIDWRVTARTGSPHVKLFREERERHTILCVDMNASMRFGTKKTFKSVQAARIAALLGWRSLAQQDRISACLFGDVPNGIQLFSPKRTQKSLCTIFKMLTEPQPAQQHIPLKNALQQVSEAAHTGSLIYIISDFMDVDKDFPISHITKRCDVVFIAVNDQADQALCPIGTIGFGLNNFEKFFVNTDNNTGRDAYAAQWKENRKCLYDITSKLKIPMIELTTESDIRRDLPLSLKSIVKRKNR